VSGEPGIRRSVPRKPVRLSQEDLVRKSPLAAGRRPVLVEPAVDNLDLASWARSNREAIEIDLGEHGGVLFRGFGLGSVAEFEALITAISGGALEYSERSSPRSRVSGRIYTSTDHPADQTIFLHNEQSYNLVVPGKILFFCVQAAERGGSTPIADCRAVLARLDPALVRRFIELKYCYVRNFGGAFGLSWQEAFQTDAKAAVEEYCRANAIAWEWRDGERLRTKQVRSVVARHPRTGELTWCNHITFFHVTTLGAAVRDELLSGFQEEDLPNNTYYGDGSPIESSALDELRAAYRAETLEFDWRPGDLLLLDNMLTAHGRSPFEGPRKVVVGMAEPRRWDEVDAGRPT
jgi:alpha-ketoglutarate-dependent taurine dioxygenase